MHLALSVLLKHTPRDAHVSQILVEKERDFCENVKTDLHPGHSEGYPIANLVGSVGFQF